ncbi:serine/threonine kinase-like domain-containing protein STKLD1 isoform X2 [Gigantopelta aegis]|uniref:serine/threonine kinase-like domain-containing protein STKLD1 isoform X2 n=1 Tax=Gigantopelta aegis TaxID=1735272 RepID=UPI001B888A34|nr:serine/threonine kinase-like domain-containing protein STKLD1 isoform X2 [Gigantopelta aegis]
MENYRLLERLGKGGQGSVYLAENKTDGSKCVLKKVECQDESDANQAFREALALQKLKHPYVCGYKDFFVMWDKEACAMFLCIVMDYYTDGDLRKFISGYQEKREPIDEEIVKRFLGEIMEALIFVHRQGILHRDLKPSNIFINGDGTLCLGDFGVSTIIGDIRTNTRCPPGTTNYMAPEVANEQYDERSDLWSLGCILFELASTFLYNGSTFAELLKSIQNDDEVLEESLEHIAQKFSGDLIKTIRAMLKPNPELRVSPENLVEKLPYVRSCVEISDSSSVEKRKRQLLSKYGCQPLPDTLTPESVLEHMAGTIDFEECVKECLSRLLELFKEQETILMNDNSKRLIALAMSNNMADPSIQTVGCDVLGSLALSAKAGDLLFTPEIITVIPKAMQAHPDNLELQLACVTLLMALSDAKRASVIIGELGGIKLIVNAMRNHSDSAQLVGACCHALWSLTVNEDNMFVASEEKAVVEITTALKLHQLNADVVEAACAAIVPLCLDDSIFKYANDLDLVGTIISALSHHTKVPKVIRNGSMALASLSEPNEECAFRMLAGEESKTETPSGIPVIMKAYELHKDNAEVVEAIVGLFAELAEYDGICKDLISYKTSDKLNDIRKQYSKNKSIVDPCEETLKKLDGGNVTQKAGESFFKQSTK